MDGFCVSCGHMKNGEWNREGRNWCCELCGRELDIKKPVVHVKALTYAPKIPGVLSGEIRQTIRKIGKKPVKPGDTLILHGWFGAPYRSPWSWRLKLKIEYVDHAYWRGDWFCDLTGPYSREWVLETLEKDGFSSIDKGLEFFKEYEKDTILDIIGWSWPPIKDGDER